MKVLVTGATGFLGVNLVRRLIQEGLMVRALIRNTSNTLGLERLDIEKFYGDVLNRESIANALKGCDVVFHTAGIVSLWVPNKQAKKMMWDVNVGGTINVLEEALKSNVEKVVYTSTVSTIGIKKGEPADETTSFNLGYLDIDYINSKYEAEIKAQQILGKGLPLIIVNPSYMFGEWDIKPTSGRMILEMAKGKIIGYPPGGNNFVDVEDVAKGHFLALKNGKVGERYILASQNLTYREIFEKIAQIVGVKPPTMRIPYSLSMGMSYLSEQWSKHISKKEPMITVGLSKMGYVNHYFTPQKAIKGIEFSPQTPIDESIKKAFYWFKRYGYL
ncbi:MAG: NAD-dependent epimerase/dehydratase family protein [bacterium]